MNIIITMNSGKRFECTEQSQEEVKKLFNYVGNDNIAGITMRCSNGNVVCVNASLIESVEVLGGKYVLS